MLIFEKPYAMNCDRNLFTTLRPFTISKYQYYHEQIGKKFIIGTVNA
jgi:hypothetical protein